MPHCVEKPITKLFMSAKPLVAWLLILNILGFMPWTFGPVAFVCLLGCVYLLHRHTQITPQRTDADPTRTLHLLFFGAVSLSALLTVAGFVFKPDWIIDIAQNTHAATAWFADGQNPYSHTAQLWVKTFPEGTPNLTVDDGQIYMYGVPYHHGFPYFPLMMLSYLPVYLGLDNYTGMRLTNLIFMALTLWGFKLLSNKLGQNPQQRQQLLLVCIIAYLGILRYSVEAIALGVTDILIATYLLYAFVALSYQRFLLAGLLLGAAQACKLLPAPFALLAVLLMLWGQRGFFPVLFGYAISALLITLPFLLWNPEAFASATFLYYLTHHAGGDDTSLWFFLPDLLQTPFLLLGLVATLGTIWHFARTRTLAGALAATFACYAIFMAFSKMTHLNYLWGVFPLGCAALALFMQNLQQPLHTTPSSGNDAAS